MVKAETTSPKSPENKPLNGQVEPKADTPAPKDTKKEDDGKVLKIQTTTGGKGADYNPAKKNYHPIDDAFWKRGEK